MRYRFNWFSGLLTGGAIGAAVAILSAPRADEDTELLDEGAARAVKAVGGKEPVAR
ncbi:MAG TPA: YtxH domain-containing protein [Anaerolineales bacterium]|nr:YtxH domain-containing protein [Anaerolineales bacterium]